MQDNERKAIVLRAGGWFVTGRQWSGPWNTKEAAELARDGEYTLAHQEHRAAKGVERGDHLKDKNNG